MVDKDFVKDKIAAFLKISADDLQEGTVLSNLIADSFMIVELMIELEETCGARLQQEDVKHVKTLGDLTSVVASLSHGRSAKRVRDELALSAEEV